MENIASIFVPILVLFLTFIDSTVIIFIELFLLLI